MTTLKNIIAKTLKAVTHPIGVFVLLQFVWVAVLILWVILFLSQKEAAFELAKTIGEKEIDPTYGIVLLTIGCVLLGILFVGVLMLFVFTQKQAIFLKQQKSFISSVTHELRSPLASIQLSFETLKKAGDSIEVQQKIHRMVERDISRLLNLVERILISSRLDRGIFDIEKIQNQEPVALYGLIESIILQSKHLDENILDRTEIQCDRSLMAKQPELGVSMILENLIENAIKYSPSDKKITISAIREGANLLLSVKDEGFGMTSKEKRKIFRMFYRSGMATKKAIQGTGLGLFIVKSTVALMGGRVWVESKGPSMGSTFFVSLPWRG